MVPRHSVLTENVQNYTPVQDCTIPRCSHFTLLYTYMSLQCFSYFIINVTVVKRVPISNSYTMGCPPVRGDNPRALASGLSYVQADNP